MNKNKRKELLKKIALNTETPIIESKELNKVPNKTNVSDIIDTIIDNVCDDILNSIENVS